MFGCWSHEKQIGDVAKKLNSDNEIQSKETTAPE